MLVLVFILPSNNENYFTFMWQMEAVAGSNQNKSLGDDMATDLSPPFDDSVLSDPFGEQEILPRIGEEYQAQIPELLDISSYISQTMISEMGLPIPLMVNTRDGEFVKPEDLQVHKKEVSTLEESETLKKIQSNFGTESSEFKIIPSELKMENVTALRGSSADVTSETKLCEPRDRDCFLVPGLASQSWNDAEKASFLLALYIFEKNFVLVTRFMEGKTMGNILTFYYGKFFLSPEFYRWSECRKTRSRRGVVYGQKLFTGMRLHELLSRILPSISEKCKQALLEVNTLLCSLSSLSISLYLSLYIYMHVLVPKYRGDSFIDFNSMFLSFTFLVLLIMNPSFCFSLMAALILPSSMKI